MINHLYTTLMNTYTNDSLELIDIRYIPQTFTPAQEAINFEIFPKEYPLRYKSLIATTLEMLVWGSALSKYLEAIDKRSTIRLSEKIDINILDNSLSLTQLVNGVDIPAPSDYPLVASGQYISDPSVGKFSSTWRIEYHTSSSISIIDLDSKKQFYESIIFSNQGAPSSIVNLGNGIDLRFFGVTSVPRNINATVKATSPVSINIFEIADRVKSNSNVHAIFQSKSDLVDMQYLGQLFFSDDSVNVNLPAILVAYAASFSDNLI